MKKGRPGRPVSLMRSPEAETRIALAGNPVGYPMLFSCFRNHVYRTEFAAELAVVDDHVVADQPDICAALNDAVGDAAAHRTFALAQHFEIDEAVVQRDLVAHAAGRMLVGGRPGQRRD